MAHTRNSALATEHHRLERESCSPEFGEELKQISADIRDPVTKLRYLRGAIESGYEPPIEHVPFAPARRWWYRFRSLKALDVVVAAKNRSAPEVDERSLLARKRARLNCRRADGHRGDDLPPHHSLHSC